MRNLAQTVTSEYFPREEFTTSTRPSLAGREAPASVEITLISLPRTLREGKLDIEKISTQDGEPASQKKQNDYNKTKTLHPEFKNI